MSCGFLEEKPHTWSLPAARSRKSGYASVEMTKGRAVLPETVVAEPKTAEGLRGRLVVSHPAVAAGIEPSSSDR
jgi:hypothetical protein